MHEPIEAFLCSKLAIAKATKHVRKMAADIPEKDARDYILSLPITGVSKVPKNTLLAISTNNKAIFSVNLKTGEATHE